MPHSTLFDQVGTITYDYLGPAANRFVSRQISGHLHKKPEELTRADLPGLIDWMRLAMGFLTDDQALIREYVARLESLETEQPSKQARKEHV